jgi:hypothetical protein
MNDEQLTATRELMGIARMCIKFHQQHEDHDLDEDYIESLCQTIGEYLNS